MMLDTSRPATRILAVLELLQDRPGITGPRLAQELDVSGRTIRRYIASLQDMGIPVEPTPGRIGGYSLRRGFRLPPLMFSADEALGLASALLATRSSRDTPLPPHVEQALAKIERVLPAELNDRIQAIRDGVALPESAEWGSPIYPDPTTLARLAQACLARQRVWIRYSRPNGEESAREVDPYGLGTLYGRWYMHGYCHRRKDRRTFRIDRIPRMDVLEETFDPPPDIDILDEIIRSIAMAWTDAWRIEVIIHAPIEAVQCEIPREFAVIDPIDDRTTRLTTTTNDLEWFAWRMCAVRQPMTIVSPPELKEAFRTFANRLLASADA